MRRRTLVAAVATALAATSLGAGRADAVGVRSCGDIPESSRHLAIWNVTTRGLSCPTGRKAALKLFACSTSRCSAVGLEFRCRNLGAGEAVDERCVAGATVVRFQTGV
jgi:hypothetical protein